MVKKLLFENLKEYSKRLEEERRGTNSMDLELVKKYAKENAERIEKKSGAMARS